MTFNHYEDYMEREILTPNFRLHWPHLAEQNDKGRYDIVMLFDKSADRSKMKKAVDECIKEKWGENPKFKLMRPFKDGNEKIDERTGDVYPEYADMIWATAQTKFAVTVLDPKKRPIPTAQLEAQVYAGCYCIAQVSAYAWEHKEDGKILKRGVSFNLCNLMKVGEGERIGGGGCKRQSAEEAFADVEVESDGSDDASNYANDDL